MITLKHQKLKYKFNDEKIRKTLNLTIISKNRISLFVLEDSSFLGFDDKNFYIGKFYNIFHLTIFKISNNKNNKFKI